MSRGQSLNILTVNQDLTARRIVDTEHQVEQSGLSESRRPYNGVGGAGLDCNFKIFEQVINFPIFSRVAKGNFLELNMPILSQFEVLGVW